MTMLHWPNKIDEDLLLAISRANVGQIELTADGTLITAPPTSSTGSLGEISLQDQVIAWQRVHDPDGFVLPSSAGVTLPDGGIWSPDTTYISSSTYDSATEEDLARAFWRIVPDAVFELLSESDRVGSPEYDLKMGAYKDNAIPLVVVLDPKERRTLTSRNSQPVVESFDRTLDLGSHMPGLVLDVAAVFTASYRRRPRK
jgi:Uma2 family endonuclease